MASTKRHTVVGVFQSRAAAEKAVDDLRQAGFSNDEIGFVARDAKGEVKAEGPAQGAHTGTGAIAGAAAGVGVGGLIGLGVLSGVLPVIGPAIAAGTLGVILSNAAAGGAIAGIIGALIGLGIPEEEAKYYESEVHAGRFVVSVKGGTRLDEAWRIMQRHGAYSFENRATAATAGASSAHVAHGGVSTAAGEKSMTLHEEQLHARKQPVKAGEVRVHKEVVTEQQHLSVPVQREEVVIERHPVSGQSSTSSIRQGEEIRIPVTEEQVRVEKETVAKEQVNIGKRKVQETEQVAGTVRKEQARVEREGDVNVRNKNTGK